MLIFEPAAGVMDGAAFAAADNFIFGINSAMAIWTSKGYRSHLFPPTPIIVYSVISVNTEMK